MIWYDMNWYDMSYDPLLSKHTYETRFWRYVPRSKFFIYHWFHREKPGAFLIQFLPTLLDRQRDFVLHLSCTTQLNVVNNKKKGFGWIRNHWNQDFGISVLCVVCPQTETGSFRFFWHGSKLGTPKLWMVNTKLDIHICGPTSVFHFDPHPYSLLLFIIIIVIIIIINYYYTYIQT